MLATTTIPIRQQAIRVLVVEDGAVHQKLADGLLRRHGCLVTLVDNGRAALRAVEKQQFDLILMDVELPEMDGITATRVIRQHERQLNRYTPVIGLSSSRRESDCLAAGMDEYVAKPLRDDVLERVLDQIKPRPMRRVAPGSSSGQFALALECDQPTHAHL